VLAHGASAQIRALADEQKITPSNLDGSGITDAATLKLALTAATRLTHEILEGLSANDLRADTGMHAEQFKIVNVENNEELASVGS